jgi:hypothetical protein
MTARNEIISNRLDYNPESKVYKEKEIVAKLEKLAHDAPEKMKTLAEDFKNYLAYRNQFNFRENTFDKQKHSSLAIGFMLLYFIFFLPFTIFGAIVNYIPYKFIPGFVERRVKQNIFISSGKYIVGIFLFPLWYLFLTILVYFWLGSILSALIFLISFPITGHIAYYYFIDLKKWFSVLRFKRMDKAKREELLEKRDRVINAVDLF